MDAPEKKNQLEPEQKLARQKKGMCPMCPIRPMKPALIRKEFMFALIVNLSDLFILTGFCSSLFQEAKTA